MKKKSWDGTCVVLVILRLFALGHFHRLNAAFLILVFKS